MYSCYNAQTFILRLLRRLQFEGGTHFMSSGLVPITVLFHFPGAHFRESNPGTGLFVFLRDSEEQLHRHHVQASTCGEYVILR